MLCKKLFCAGLALSGLFAYSQSNYQHGFLSFGAVTEEARVYPDYPAIEKKLHERYDTLFRKKDESDDFIKFMMVDLHNEMENGSIYANWKEGEDYINSIFRSIIPAGSDSLNVKIVRSADVNAFMTGTGQAYITVGYLASALNEAEIATTLGHEYGHHTHLDYYKRYQEILKNERHRFISSFLGNGGAAFYYLSTSRTFRHFRDMEREADKMGIELAKAANYNLLAEVNVMKRFKMIDDNYEKTRGYRSVSYFHTHPPTEERIKYGMQSAAATDTMNALYFKVDEALFRKIKLQAIDECINLLMQQEEYEDCIELCYRQLLFNPNDEFYLFYINEALRRYILSDTKEADRLFITGRYMTYSKYPPRDKLPKYVISEKFAKAGNDKWTQTISYHYEFLMLADKNTVIAKLPDNSLTRTDTLEFVSNKDALNYFISCQEKNKQGSVNWVKNCMAGNVQGIEINSAEPFLNRYNEVKKDILAFKPSTVFDQVPLLITRPSYRGNAVLAGQDFDADSLTKECLDYVKSKVGPPFQFFNYKTISIAEKSTFINTVQGLMDLTFPITADQSLFKTEKDETKNIQLSLMAPEALSLLNKYKLQQFIVADIRYTDAMTTAIGGISLSVFAAFNIYYFDFRNGYTTHVMRKYMVATGDIDTALKHLYDDLLLGLVKNEETGGRK